MRKRLIIAGVTGAIAASASGGGYIAGASIPDSNDNQEV